MRMNREYIQQHDIVRRYQQKRLNDEELEAFELFILENPGILVNLEEERLLHDTIKASAASLDGRNGNGTLMWVGGVAASLLLVCVTLFNLPAADNEYQLRDPVTLQSFRGATDSTVQLGGQPVVQFRIDVGPPEFLDSNAFTAELIDESGVAAFPVSGLQADADGWVYYALTGQNTELSGKYRVRLYPDASPHSTTSYPVEFIAP